MSELSWYYAEEGIAVGPRSQKDMLDLVKAGKLTPSALIWHPAMAEWEPLEKVQPDWLKAPEPKPQPQSQPVTADKKTAPVLVAAVAAAAPPVSKTTAAPAKPGMASAPEKNEKKPEPAAPEKKGGLLGKLFKR